MKISKLGKELQFSPIRKFNKYAIAAEKAGKKIYRLNIGQPDIATPPVFMEAIRNFDNPVLGYEASTGDLDLIDAVQKYFERLGVSYDQDDILITCGGSEALSMTLTSVIDQGDGVMLPEPFYTNYHSFITSAGGRIVPILTSPEDGYFYADPKLLQKSYRKECRAILLVSPGNPTGTVLSKEDMRVICDFAIKHDLWIISDECYREFVYDSCDLLSFAQFEDISERLVIIDSVSKRFSACGARIGFIATKNKELQDAVMKQAQGRLCCPTLEMKGAEALYRLDPSYFDAVREEYKSRRDCMFEALNKIPGVVCEKKPSGAFYMMATLPVEDAEEFLVWLLTEFDHNGETLMYSPAMDFYATEGNGINEIRFAYTKKKEDIIRAMELLGIALEQYKAAGHK